jgi:hypothetical protein
MSNLYKYGRSATNQGAGTMSKMTAGINEYLPANTINDAMMSDEIDVYPYREECVLFNADTAINGKSISNTKDLGYVRKCIHSDESTTDTEVFYLMTSKTAGWLLVKHIYTISTDTTSIHTDAMTIGSVPADPTLVDSSCAIFKVEADTYYVFSNTHEKRIHFIKHTATADTYGYVDVPAFPKKMVAHASRIFFIDTQNKIWWCRAGDLYSWYSMEYDADAIVTTANCANAAFTIAAQPNTTRQITATVTKVDVLDTLGVLTIVGTNGLDVAQTEVLTLIEGRAQGSMAFKTITSVTQSGWTIGGTTADTIVIGTAPVGLGFVTDDAGFWTLEQELYLHDFCILGNSMYIFTNHNIYAFHGYSPDTFSLSKSIADIGIDRMETPNGYTKLTTGRNVAYFIYDGFVYEFDGNNQPRIMSRPVVINNQSSNGIMGGIDFAGESWVLQSIADALCLYDYTGDTDYYYFYRFETKTWWKRSGFGINNIVGMPSYNPDLEYLVIGGGGGGVSSGANGGGGGGAGGYLHVAPASLAIGTYPVVIGDGGYYLAGQDASTDGAVSSFNGSTALGGGGGGSRNGASGGGANWYDQIGGLGTPGQGYNGGDSTGLMAFVGGAGGGSGGLGGNAIFSPTTAGIGGIGTHSSITGSDVEYAKGGYGGGDAVYNNQDALANTGNGGHGCTAGVVTHGGSGVVIVRYPTGSVDATGGTITHDGAYTVHTFTSSGSLIVTDPIYATPKIIEKILYVPAFNRQEWFNFISVLSDTQDYVYANEQGCTQGVYVPFFITKAFNTNPSETGTLTEIILAIQGTNSETANIKVQYSLTVDADDFLDIRTFTGYTFNGDVEIISIPVPISNIANAHHYRIRVEIGNFSDTEGVYLYNIERRFRVKGRSR